MYNIQVQPDMTGILNMFAEVLNIKICFRKAPGWKLDHDTDCPV